MGMAWKGVKYGLGGLYGAFLIAVGAVGRVYSIGGVGRDGARPVRGGRDGRRRRGGSTSGGTSTGSGGGLVVGGVGGRTARGTKAVYVRAVAVMVFVRLCTGVGACVQVYDPGG